MFLIAALFILYPERGLVNPPAQLNIAKKDKLITNKMPFQEACTQRHSLSL
jgi:hypothetical protein